MAYGRVHLAMYFRHRDAAKLSMVEGSVGAGAPCDVLRGRPGAEHRPPGPKALVQVVASGWAEEVAYDAC
eukprot:10458179-Lingulodinium_polyedra.AAC.1